MIGCTTDAKNVGDRQAPHPAASNQLLQCRSASTRNLQLGPDLIACVLLSCRTIYLFLISVVDFTWSALQLSNFGCACSLRPVSSP
jgi:hypothetical protein